MTRDHKILHNFHIHPALWFFIGVAVLTGSFIKLAVIFSIVFIHEMGHYLMAHFFRWRIRKMMLWPFGGVMETDEHGSRPFHEEALVLIAGPIQHFFIFGFLFLANRYGWLDADIIQLANTYNAIILFFNLLPIWPLDGGKFTFLILSHILPYSKAQSLSVIISIINIVLSIIAWYFLGSFSLGTMLLVSFLIWENRLEWKQRKFAFIRYLMRRYEGEDNSLQKTGFIKVTPTTSIFSIFAKFKRGKHHKIVVQVPGEKKVSIDERQCLHAYFKLKEFNVTAGELAMRFDT